MLTHDPTRPILVRSREKGTSSTPFTVYVYGFTGGLLQHKDFDTLAEALVSIAKVQEKIYKVTITRGGKAF